jgi:hypothetical protein
MDVLNDAAGVKLQFSIWGYAMTGDLIETAALVAEGRAELVHGAWDRTARDLATEMIAHGDEPYRRVKDWAACPWIGEHMLRGHGEWPGL